MKIKPLFVLFFISLFLFQYKTALEAQEMIPEIKLSDYYDEASFSQAFNTLEQNAKEIESDMERNNQAPTGRQPNSEASIVPNQTSRKVQEEIPNHERNFNNSMQSINQKSIPNDAKRRPNQESIMVR